MKKKLPKDVVMRIKTNENDEPMAIIFPTTITPNLLTTITTTAIVNPTNYSLANSNEYKELIELAKEIKEVKKQGSYILGKRDLYIDILKRFDECKSIPDLYKIIDEMRNELNKLS